MTVIDIPVKLHHDIFNFSIQRSRWLETTCVKTPNIFSNACDFIEVCLRNTCYDLSRVTAIWTKCWSQCCTFKLLIRSKDEQLVFNDWTTNSQAKCFFCIKTFELLTIALAYPISIACEEVCASLPRICTTLGDCVDACASEC